MAASQSSLAEQPAPKQILPSQRVIALAISVVSSKPPELSVGEYIRLLRQHVAKGRRSDAISTSFHHLDRTSYWRAECERNKEALKTARNESIDLRRQIECLKAKVDSARAASPAKKRKKQDQDVVPVPRSPKKAKRNVMPARSDAFDLDLVDDEDHEAGETGDALLRSVFHVQTVLKSHKLVQTTELAHYLDRASINLPKIVEEATEGVVTSNAHDLDQLTATLVVASRAIICVIRGYTRLSSLPDSMEVSGRVIHAMVQMFQNLLSGLRKLSLYEVQKDLPRSGKKSSDKGKAKDKTPKVVNVKDTASMSLFTKFLSNIIDALNPQADGHKALFEGFAFCILDTLGSRLYHTVFGRSRGATMEAEIQKSHVGEDEIEDEHGPPTQEKSELEERQVKLEAPYLIHLLKRIMAAAPSHLGTLSGKASKAKQASTKSATKGNLAISAKECLQRTLVNCTFGTEGMDEDDSFAEFLKMPAPGVGSIPLPRVKEVDVREWFTEEMWRLLGWEILEKEVDGR